MEFSYDLVIEEVFKVFSELFDFVWLYILQ